MLVKETDKPYGLEKPDKWSGARGSVRRFRTGTVSLLHSTDIGCKSINIKLVFVILVWKEKGYELAWVQGQLTL